MKCLRCGQCCWEYSGMLIATAMDIERWKRQDRKDILKYANPIKSELTGKLLGWELWFDPKTKKEVIPCPFLKKTGEVYTCLIYNTRPENCRDYFCNKVRI